MAMLDKTLELEEQQENLLFEIKKRIGKIYHINITQTNIENIPMYVSDFPTKKLEKKYPEINFVGVKTGDELAKYYANADVFVFPSKTDTLGNVILEALASGTPIAAYPVTGPIDVLTDEKINTLDNDLLQSVKKALKVKRVDCRNFTLKLTWDKCVNEFLEFMVKV